MKTDYDVVILGAGPAGLTASIYLSRMMVNNLIIEKDAPGGKLLNTFRVENYTGVIGKDGPQIAMDFFNHAISLGAKIQNGIILKIDDIEDKIKKIHLKNKNPITTKAIIVATGLEPRRLEVKDYDALFGRGIHTCLICDAPLYKNKKIAVIGGGNSALEESIFATNFVDKLSVVNISQNPTAFDYVVSELKEKKNVEIFNETTVKKINHKDGKVFSITLENIKTNEEFDLDVSAIFTYIGWNPNTTFLPEKILDKYKYIEVNNDCETKIPGIFGAGDVTQKKYKQLVTATSDGAVSALSAKKYIESIK